MDTPNSKAVIELRDVSYRYPGAKDPVLEKVSLSIHRGEFVVVGGATGCGKSTLGLVLAGIVPDRFGGDFDGDVRIEGQRGIVFQNPDSQLFSLTIGDDIAFGPRNAGCDEEDVDVRVREAARETGIERILGNSPNLVSSGEKQRAVLASVLSMEPEILVLDEPTAFLDPAGKEAVMRLLWRLSDTGATIVMMEHNIGLARRFGCKIIWLRDGCVVEERDNGDLRDEKPFLNSAIVMNGHGRGPVPNGGGPVPNGGGGAIEISSLCFRYPVGNEVLRDIDLSIGEGEFVGILGANGSGKTTLAKHLNGLLSPTSGKVVVFGREPGPENVGYAFQDPDYQLFETTVEREVAFGPENMRMEKDLAGERVREAVAAVGLLDVMDVDPHMLSAGQKRCVGMASVLAMKPRIMVLDEPSAGLDDQKASHIMEMLSKFNQEGRLVIVLSHNVSLVSRFCTRVIVMKKGEIMYDGAPGIEAWIDYIL